MYIAAQNNTNRLSCMNGNYKKGIFCYFMHFQTELQFHMGRAYKFMYNIQIFIKDFARIYIYKQYLLKIDSWLSFYVFRHIYLIIVSLNYMKLRILITMLLVSVFIFYARCITFRSCLFFSSLDCWASHGVLSTTSGSAKALKPCRERKQWLRLIRGSLQAVDRFRKAS